MDNQIIYFPEFEEISNEVNKLKTELSMLLSERDELVYVQCKNIEMAYVLALGGIEYKAYELHCKVLRLKRKIDLVQAKKNRQEKVVLADIEVILDQEFEEFQKNLNEQINKMNEAIERSNGRVLTDAETKELKKLYRAIVKVLHPDINPGLSSAQFRLFQNAVSAYENGDLLTLRMISEAVAETTAQEDGEDTLSVLIKERDRLNELLKVIRKEIEKIKSEYPYTMKDVVADPELIELRKEAIEELISELKETYETYSLKLNEMMGK